MNEVFRYLLIGLQLVAAVVLLVLVIIGSKQNQWGQNIINVGACLVLMVRLENILALYRLHLNQSYLENQATVMLVTLVGIGKLGELYNPTSPYANPNLNRACLVFLVTVIALNLVFYVVMFITLLFYMIRQLYKLMNGTLLSSQAMLQAEEIEVIRGSARRYSELLLEHPSIGAECSVCLSNFEPAHICIVLPGCEHCYHQPCIEEWLSNKSSCPNCRNNIRLGMMREAD